VDYGFQVPGPDPRGIGLFKLHGSLNWGTCGCGEIVPLPWEHMGSVPRTPDTSDWGYLRSTDRLGSASHGCGQGNTGEPAIVPPSWNKTQYRKGFARVWSRAAAELAAAENIVVIGYSLPDSDAFFHDLFRLGLPGPTRVRRFVVIDPSEDARERFRRLLGPELRVRFEPHDWAFEGNTVARALAPERVADWIVNQPW